MQERLTDQPILLWAAKAVGSFVVAEVSGLPGPANTLIYLVALDYFSGIIAAALEGKLNPRRSLVGIIVKFFYFVGVYTGHKLSEPIRDVGDIGAMIAVYLCVTEGISIFDNMQRMGIKLPAGLLQMLESRRSNADSEWNKNVDPEQKK